MNMCILVKVGSSGSSSIVILDQTPLCGFSIKIMLASLESVGKCLNRFKNL